VNNDKTRQVIVYCSIGGTLQTFVERKGPKAKKYNDPERLFGRQSRSLKAIYELQQAGFTNVVHMKDGLNQWMHLDLPLEAVD
jgi:rhodanese-related sulfurtransferase